MRTALIFTAVTLTLISAAGASAAKAFGPATADIDVDGTPVVTLSGGMGTETFSDFPITLFDTTGDLSSAPATGGTIDGTVSFSQTVGVTEPDVLSDFITIPDGTGGSYVFDATSVRTLTFSVEPGVTTFGLYLLGTTSDTNLGLTPGPTSVTITSNKTGSSGYSASASLSSPPAMSVVEPAAWALMLVGFGFAGGAIRARRKAASVAALGLADTAG